MAPPRNAAIAWSQYLAARVAEMTLTAGGIEGRLTFARFAGRRLFQLTAKHRQRTLDHLAFAFPEKTEQQRRDLAIRVFEHFVMLATEVCYTPKLLHPGNWTQHMRLGEVRDAVRNLCKGEPSIVLTGHCGNWEVLGTMMSLLGFPMHAIARPIDNPLVNDWLIGIREKRGMEIITKWNATDRMTKVLEAGEVLGFIADQNAGDRGMFVPFFGRLASTYKSIGLLAVSTETPVVCGVAHRLGNHYQYEVHVHDVIEPAHWADHPDPVYYVTARYMHAIENMVRRHPEQYLWMHRRWKSRPTFVRKDKPMPKNLRQNLERLPWVDDETIDAMADPKRDGMRL